MCVVLGMSCIVGGMTPVSMGLVHLGEGATRTELERDGETEHGVVEIGRNKFFQSFCTAGIVEKCSPFPLVPKKVKVLL